MRIGILIDPHKREISEVSIDDDYRAIYAAIGCDTFGVVALDGNDTLFIDEDGLCKPDLAFFAIGTCQTPLAGKAIILGEDRFNGEFNVVTPKPSNEIEIVRAAVKWLDPADAVSMQHKANTARRAAANRINRDGSGTFAIEMSPSMRVDPTTGKAKVSDR